MRYLGSKVKLLDEIQKIIDKNHIEGETFADLFAGTGCVGDYFKNKYMIEINYYIIYGMMFIKQSLEEA